jgi:hypothetical protein
LRRLLLGFDGPPFRRRRYEHYLDRRFNSARMRRENAAGARANKPRDGLPPCNLGSLHPGWLLELWYVLSGRFALRIISLLGQRHETCRCVIAMAEATLAETETKLKELRKFKHTLATNLTRWKRKRRGPIAAEFCALIEATG